MAGTGLAQAQVVIGGKPEVEVDTSVLDQLGPPSNLPELFLQETPRDTRKVTLIPPKSQRTVSQKFHHSLAKDALPESEPGAVHLHPITHHAHHPVERKSAAKPVKEVKAVESKPAAPAADAMPPTLQAAPSPAPTPAPAPAPAPAAPPKSTALALTPPPAPAPAKTAPMTLTPAPAPAPAPAPTPSPAPAPTPAPRPSAALTAQPNTSEIASAATGQESLSTVAFDKDSARLPDGARETLAHLASRMTEDATLEVQLLAYAAGDDENASKARRLSLSRALAVRSFLIDQGVRSTRIEVRALGNKVPQGAPDRVDIVGQKRG